jgi:hypothetical protein
MNCTCKPVLYLDGQVVKVLRIDFCPRHAQVDDLLQALAQALEAIEALTQGARPARVEGQSDQGYAWNNLDQDDHGYKYL